MEKILSFLVSHFWLITDTFCCLFVFAIALRIIELVQKFRLYRRHKLHKDNANALSTANQRNDHE